MKLLVTGGAGFMGSHFVRYILNKYPDYSVVNLDKLTYAGNLDNLLDIASDPRYTFIQGDIADESIVQDVVTGIDAVINYAAETHVDRSIQEPRSFAITDVIGTLTLLQAVRDHKISRYIQISTDEVFGSITEGKAKENSPFEPNSPYSASKAGGDHLCRAFFVTYNTPAIITHSCNFYGPYHYPEKLIPLFITNLLDNKKVPLYANGKNIREWIYTEDHCRAIDLILHKGKEGEIYNISTEQAVDNLTLTRKLLDLLDKDESYIEHVKDRPGHDFRYALDATKLRDQLGWQPTYDLDAGLKMTVEWYKKNPLWWQKIKSGEYQKYYQQQYGKR